MSNVNIIRVILAKRLLLLSNVCKEYQYVIIYVLCHPNDIQMTIEGLGVGKKSTGSDYFGLGVGLDNMSCTYWIDYKDASK